MQTTIAVMAPFRTLEQIDMVVSPARGGQQHVMRMERGRRDGSTAIAVQEAGVRLKLRKLRAAKVEHLDLMVRVATKTSR
jgi:hypothetical protein